MMDIRVSSELGRVPITVLHVAGDIDMATSEHLLSHFRQVHEAGARDIVIDMTDVPYMSSAGLRALHEIFTKLRGSSSVENEEAMRKGLSDGTFKSPHLKLANPTKHVREVLSMSGYDMFLEIHPNVKDAVASF